MAIEKSFRNPFLISRAHVEMKIKTCAYKKKTWKKSLQDSCRYRLSISVKDAHVKFLNCKNCMRKKERERERGTRIIHWMACVVYPQKAFRYQLIVNYKRGNNPKKTTIDCLAWCIVSRFYLPLFSFNRWDFCPTSHFYIFNLKL